ALGALDFERDADIDRRLDTLGLASHVGADQTSIVRASVVSHPCLARPPRRVIEITRGPGPAENAALRNEHAAGGTIGHEHTAIGVLAQAVGIVAHLRREDVPSV